MEKNLVLIQLCQTFRLQPLHLLNRLQRIHAARNKFRYQRRHGPAGMLLVKCAVFMRQIRQLYRILPIKFSPHIHRKQQGYLCSVIIMRTKDIHPALPGLENSPVIFHLKFIHAFQDPFGGIRLIQHQHKKLIHLYQKGNHLERALMTYNNCLIRIAVTHLPDSAVIKPVRIGEHDSIHILHSFHPI